METKRKVLAYIIRIGMEGGRELLTFTHEGMPEAGIQVPGGTVEERESLLEALQREIEEESGLKDLALARHFGTHEYITQDRSQLHTRYLFEVKFIEEPPDKWTHVVKSNGDDNNLIFNFSWIPLEEAETLIGDLGKYWRDL